MYDNLLADVPTDLWIGGKWRQAADGGRFDVIDPATENKVASVASATVADAKAALDAASKFFAFLVAIPGVVMVMAWIVGVVAMMVVTVVMMVAVVAVMMAVPSCGWNGTASRDCANNT